MAEPLKYPPYSFCPDILYRRQPQLPLDFPGSTQLESLLTSKNLCASVWLGSPSVGHLTNRSHLTLNAKVHSYACPLAQGWPISGLGHAHRFFAFLLTHLDKGIRKPVAVSCELGAGVGSSRPPANLFWNPEHCALTSLLIRH